MSYTVVIPARYASTRLPGKALANIAGRPMIAHVVDRANESAASRVVVATDDQRIAKALEYESCEICMTRVDHLSGSDRLTEVVDLLNIKNQEIVVNVQGDEPLIPGRLIDQVARALSKTVAGKTTDVVMSTAAQKITQQALLQDPNVVKVVFDRNGRALYFSRAAIPFARDARVASAWHHIGIYAYKASFLKRYKQLQPSPIEKTESLEQLRVLDNGYSIMVETIDYDTGIGVDTADDLAYVRKLMTS